MATRRLVVEVVGDTKNLDRGLRGLQSQTDKTSSSFRRAAQIIGGFVAFDTLKRGVSAAVGEFEEARKVGAQTTAVIKSTGGAANVTAKHVADLAGSISKKVGVDDEAIQSGENLLLTFKNVRNELGRGNKVFDRATKAAVDLSAAGFGDLASTSKQLGKALNDPVKGLAALSRSGVTFTEQQKNTIESLVAQGKTLKAQKIILKEVESQVQGSAQAQATALDKAKVAFGNLAEAAGAVLVPALDKAAIFAADLINQMIEGKSVGGALVSVFRDTGTGIGALVGAIRDAIGWFKQHETVTLALGAALGVVLAAFAGFKIVAAVQVAVVALTGAVSALNLALLTNPITLVVAALAALAAGIVVAYRESDTFRTIVDGAWQVIKAVAAWLVDAGVAAFHAVKDAVTAAWTVVRDVTQAVWNNGVKQFLAGVFDAIKSMVVGYFGLYKTVITGAWGAVKTVTEAVWGAIKTIAAGAWEGLRTLAVTAWDAIKLAILTPIRAARDVIGGEGGIWGQIKAVAAGAWEALRATAGMAWDAIKAAILAPIRAARDLLGGKDGIWGQIKEIASTAWDGIKDAIKAAADPILDVILAPFKAAVKGVAKFAKLILEVVGKIPGVDTGGPVKAIDKFVEGLAQGGVFGGRQGFARGGAFARTGGMVSQPITLMGEEAPCIAGGTLIETSAGQRPIERVRVGEFVRTRSGWREVLWSGITRRDAEVVRVRTVGGYNVLCTPDHRIWVASGDTDANKSRNCVGRGPVRGRGLLPHHEGYRQEPVRDAGLADDGPGHSRAVPGHSWLGAGANRVQTRRAEDDLLDGSLATRRPGVRHPFFPAVAGHTPEGEGNGTTRAHREARGCGCAAGAILPTRPASVGAGEHLHGPQRSQCLSRVQARGESAVDAAKAGRQPGVCGSAARGLAGVPAPEAHGPRAHGEAQGTTPRLVSPEACWRETRTLAVGDWVWTLGVDGEFHATRVESITSEPRVDTYDLMVDDEHEFVAGGILVHNSHPEFVIPTNPAYRKRAQGLLAQAAGVIGLADGGVISAFRQAISRTAAPAKSQVALFEAGIVESGLENLPYGDADSRGVLQIRDSTAGPMGVNNMSPLESALAFLTRGFWGKGSAIGLANSNPTQSAGWVAQNTQGSAFPDRYDQVMGQAIAYLKGKQAGAGWDAAGDVLGALNPADLIGRLPGVGDLPGWLGGLGEWVLGKVKDQITGLLSFQNVGGKAGPGAGNMIVRAIHLAEAMGHPHPTEGQLTGGQHAPDSLHYAGRAVDFGDAGQSLDSMQKLFYALADQFGSKINELFYDPMPWHIDSFRKIPGPFGGHSDHIHIGFQKGGVYGGLPFIGSFHDGGVAPVEGLAHVLPGETMTPAGREPVVELHFADGMEWLNQFVSVRIRENDRSAQAAFGAGLAVSP